MKAKFFFILSAFLAGGWAAAQTNSPPTPKPHVVDVPQPEQPSATATPSGDNLDPAKIAEYQKRFEQGYALEQAGKLVEARAIYEGILADQPTAKGSLLHAAEISFELGDPSKANDYLERLCALVPDEEMEKLHEQKPDEFPDVLELLIEVNQALKHDVKVELLIKRLTDLRESGNLVGLSKRLWFDRELIKSDQQDIVISQFFDYTQDPNTVWMAEVFDSAGELKRRLLLNYDAATTQALRAKDAKYAGTQVFTWFEHVIKDGQVREIDAYLQIFALPDYQKFRSAMFVILANPPKPIYSAPVDAAQH
jgi:tetratricopeptide (TPR) repeat protein